MTNIRGLLEIIAGEKTPVRVDPVDRYMAHQRLARTRQTSFGSSTLSARDALASEAPEQHASIVATLLAIEANKDRKIAAVLFEEGSAGARGYRDTASQKLAQARRLRPRT